MNVSVWPIAALMLVWSFANADQPADKTLYLEARKAFESHQYAETIQTCEKFLQQFPESAWRSKVRFLMADAYAQQHAFDKAASIYEAEAQHLLSADRKRELAQILIRFAEHLSRQPGKDELDAPPPDYEKAHRLYEQVLQLEIPEDLRDDVLFQRARVRQLAKQWRRAIGEYQEYLNAFDPESQQPPSNRQPGRHVYEAYVRMAECELEIHAPNAAIRLEDLIARLAKLESRTSDQETLLRDARFLLTRAYQDAALFQAVKAVRDFLDAYPDDPRHVRLRYQLAQTYEKRGRYEEALKAYRAFVAGEGIQPTDQPTDEGMTVRDLYEHLRMEATYNIGQILFAQKRYSEAIEAWQGYVAQFPNGPRWTNAQKRIIDAEFAIGLEQMRREQYEDAKRTWDRFLAEHPLDPRCRRILFLYGALYVKDPQPSPEAVRRAIGVWEQLVRKYPNTEEASYAQWRIGQAYEKLLGDMEKALEAYRKLTWGPWADAAKQQIARLTQKELQVITERTFRTDETPTVTVRTRNIEALTVSVYAFDLEAYWRKRHAVSGIEDLDIGLIDPDKTWTFSIPDYQKYRPFESRVEIPMEGPGVWVVRVGEEDWEATTLVIRSDLELILKSSRKEALVFVQDMRQNQPVQGARVLLSDGEQVIAEGETNAEGVFQRTLPALKQTGNVSAFAVADGNVAASELLDVSGLRLRQGLSPRGYIYTDRPAYRPGQEVAIRGILRDVRQGSYAVPEAPSCVVQVLDSQQRPIHEETLPLSEFGTFHTRLTLDAEAPVGDYRIVVHLVGRPQPTFTGSFQVQRFQLQKVSLKIEFPRSVYFRGEMVEATLTAAYFTGESFAGREVVIHLPDGRRVQQTTDETGRVQVRFDTTHYRPGVRLTFQARLPSEDVSVTGSVFLARLGYAIEVRPQDEGVIAGEPIEVLVETRDPEGKPVGRDLTLLVLKRQHTQPIPLLQQTPWFSTPKSQVAEVEVQRHSLRTDPETGQARLVLTLEEGGEYLLRAQGTDRFGQMVVGEAALQVWGEQDAQRLRLFADRTHLRVGEQASVRVHSRLQPALALVTFEGEGVIAYRIVLLQPGFNELTFDVGHEYFPNFNLSVSVIDVQGRLPSAEGLETEPRDRDPRPVLRLATRSFTVERQLRLTIKPAKDVYAPGEEARFEILAHDSLGRPVRAELSLALVDEALFALFPEAVPPIREFFEQGQRREAAMRTVSSCTFRYAPPTRGVIQAWTEEAERIAQERQLKQQRAEAQAELRKSFERLVPEAAGAEGKGTLARVAAAPEKAKSRLPVARPAPAKSIRMADRMGAGLAGVVPMQEELLSAGVWLPAVVTDEEGRATVRFAMPDKTTRWRLTARGCTVETLVGEVKVTVVTRKDFFLDLKLPTILTEGDQVRPLVWVHNLTEAAGEVPVQLAWFAGNEAGSRVQTVSVQPKATAEVVFEAIPVPPVASLRFEVSATLPGEGSSLQDALRKEVPVRPWGIEVSDQKSGVATGDRTLFLELPDLPSLEPRRLTLQIAPRLERLILDLALSGGWIREKSTPGSARPSEIHPSRPIIHPPGDVGNDLLAVAAALEYLRSVPGSPKDVALLLRRARRLVNVLVVRQNDGWTWSPGSKERDPRLSARNLWALVAIKAQGVAVPEETLAQATRYVQSTLTQTDDEETRALLLHALTEAGKEDFSAANRLYRNRPRLTPRGLAVTALIFARTNRPAIAGELLDRLLQDAKLEEMPADVLAFALLALQASRPRSDRVEPLVEALLAKRRWGGFVPYHAKGPATLALARYYRQGQFASTDYRLTVVVNGQAVYEGTIQRHQPLLELDAEPIPEGPNRVEFRVEGQARYAYTVTLSGFLRDVPETLEDDSPLARVVRLGQVERHFYHAPLEYKGRPVASSTSEITQLPYGERTRVTVRVEDLPFDTPLVVVESLPAGAVLLRDTLSGNYQHVEIGDSTIRFYLDRWWGIGVQRDRGRRPSLRFQYEVMGYTPGTYRILPLVVFPGDAPDRRWVGKPGKLVLLARGETSPDPYVMNDAERFNLGKAYFEDGDYAEALPLLEELHKRNPDYQEREVARMLLWIRTEEGFFDAPAIVDAFEILHERFPDLTIPFDRIRVVGRAYREMGEQERAWLVFRSTLSASYASDSGVGAVLQDEGQVVNSFALQKRLWQVYPDTSEVIASFFGLSQAIYARVPEASNLAKAEVLPLLEPAPAEEEITAVTLLRDVVRLLTDFLTMYPNDPLADDAYFSLANAYLDLEAYADAVKLCEVAQERYPKSEFLSSFQYMRALGLFSQHKFDEAVEAARPVAEGESQDRDLARYILGQIYHAQGKPEEAIRWYATVRDQYADAAESIQAFRAKRIALPEVSRFRPGEPVTVTLRYRNIKEAAFQVYRVDLMKLYLREKDLSQITQVRLEGIAPEHRQTLVLGDGKDYADKERTVTLDLKEEGAYLVICRGDDLFTSGLVLISPLEMEVQEDATSGRVRVNVRKRVEGGYPEGIHVKVVGSADARIVSGKTDLRGIFIADGIQGKATVLAREGQNRYAFYRGTQWLGPPKEEERGKAKAGREPRRQEAVDYRQNLLFQNRALQDANVQQFEQMRRGAKHGVQVQAAY